MTTQETKFDRNSPDYEMWAHAACLTLAEGNTDYPPIELQSPAMQAVIKLVQERDAVVDKWAAVTAQAEDDAKGTVENYNQIWKAVTRNIGDWDYPGQVVRHVEHMAEDLGRFDKLQSTIRSTKIQLENMVYNLKSKPEAEMTVSALESILGFIKESGAAE